MNVYTWSAVWCSGMACLHVVMYTTHTQIYSYVRTYCGVYVLLFQNLRQFGNKLLDNNYLSFIIIRYGKLNINITIKMSSFCSFMEFRIDSKGQFLGSFSGFHVRQNERIFVVFTSKELPQIIPHKHLARSSEISHGFWLEI